MNLRQQTTDHLNVQNRALLSEIDSARRTQFDDMRPPFFQCRSRILMVADGSLDFSMSRSFGLGVFTKVILDMALPMRTEVTLGVLGRTGSLMAGETRIKDRHTRFEFDDPAHFQPERFDLVLLFGFLNHFNYGDNFGVSRRQSHRGDHLMPAELDVLGRFMQSGGGVFVTGDHGELGRAMGERLPRAGRMRLWSRTATDEDDDQVSMTGPWRNDTNQRGDAGSQFEDQSDDVPQGIYPRTYHRESVIFRYSFPHPLLCGPNGPIRVMPDHPHEGECVEPTERGELFPVGGVQVPEYPASTSGGPRPLPEVISTSIVPGGNIAKGTSEDTRGSEKRPTIPHSFGGICAYDGHRAGVGRVVTDATWHHFLNVNLTGEKNLLDEYPSPIKELGFLASPAGQAHFEEIKSYYRNLVTWISRPEVHTCINVGWVVHAVASARVIEAVVSVPDVRVGDVSARTLRFIGVHALDVVGKAAGQCQSRRLLPWIAGLLGEAPELLPVTREVDPWAPRSEEERTEPRGLGVVDLTPMFEVALGAALIEANGAIQGMDEVLDQPALLKALATGFRQGLIVFRAEARTELDRAASYL